MVVDLTVLPCEPHMSNLTASVICLYARSAGLDWSVEKCGARPGSAAISCWPRWPRAAQAQNFEVGDIW